MPVDARPAAAAAAAERETARLEAFSDGVFAITLLILELKVPPAAIADRRSLMRVAPDDPIVTTMRAQYRWGRRPTWQRSRSPNGVRGRR